MKKKKPVPHFKPSQKLEAVLDQLSSILIFEKKQDNPHKPEERKIKT